MWINEDRFFKLLELSSRGSTKELSNYEYK